MLQKQSLLQRSALWLLCALLVVGHGIAQTVTGSITGTVVDPTGGVLVGAQVTVKDEATQTERPATTNESGSFVVVGLPPSTYSVRVEMRGFRTLTRTGMVLTASERLSAGNIEMAVGQTSEAVSVMADAAAVNTATADTTSLISASQLSETLVRGRDFMNLVKTLPGATQNGGNDAQGGTFGTASPQISGIRNNYNNLTLDGASANDTDQRQSFSAGISPDAIGEIKVLSSNYLAEIGPNPGASIKLVTKSGSKEFHGSVYYFKRHKEFNATDYFVNRNGTNNPPYRMTNVGVTWGGPAYIPGLIRRESSKLFFFYNTEISRNVLPQTNMQSTVPTALERNGNFSQSFDTNGRLETIRDPLTNAPFPGNMIPANRINSQGRALLSVFPLPQPLSLSLTAGLFNYQFQNYQDVPKNSHTLKLDWVPTNKDTFSFRPKMWRSDSKSYTGIFSINSNAPLVFYDYYYSHDDLQAAWTHVLSPAAVNEFTASYTVAKERGGQREDRTYANVERPTYGISLGQLHPEINPYNFLPSMTFGAPISNPVTFATDRRAPIDCGDEVLEFTDNFSLIKGTHTMKFGIYAEKAWSSEGLRADSFNGLFNFSNDTNNPGNTGQPYATALLGNFQSYTEANAKTLGLGTAGVFEWYAQDQWQVNRRLTISYGARFSYFSWYHMREGQHGSALSFANYNPALSPRLYRPAIVNGVRVAQDPGTGATAPAVLIGAFVPGTGSISNGAVTDVDIAAGKYPSGWAEQPGIQVSPRFGFAYDVFGNGKTAIRGGFGDGKHVLGNSGLLNNMGLSAPYVVISTQYYGNFNTFLSNPGVSFSSSMSAFDRNLKVPSIYNWSFGIQQNIGFGTILDASYVGNTNRHIESTTDINAVPYGARFSSQNIDPTTGAALSDAFLRPYKEYSTLTYLSNQATSNYHSLQVQVNRRMTRNVQAGLAYTYSKAMTNEGARNVFVPAKYWNQGLQAFDQTHILVLNYTWNLPKLSALLPNPAVKAVFDDWELSGISTFASGFPTAITVTTTPTDLNGGGAGQRVNVIGNPNAGPHTFDQWFNAAAFTQPARGSFGNAGQYSFRGPGFNNFDLALSKNIPLGKESRALRIRVEAYNAFNHTQFATVNAAARFDASGNQTNAQFGQIASTRPPRVLQLSANLRF